MRTTNKLTIITKTNDLLDELYDAIAQYPKSEKFALGADTKQTGLNFYRLIITAAKELYDSRHPDRHSADWGDIGADAIGAFGAEGMIWLVHTTW